MSLRKKDHAWLVRIQDAENAKGTMYPGLREDFLPDAVEFRLMRDGLIFRDLPMNPIHKDRFCLTAKGQEILTAGRPQ